MPDPGPLGETLFEARDRAIVSASLVKRPGGGKVETVLTLADHFFTGCAMPESPQQSTQATLCLLKYCTSRSCCLACSSVANVPRLRRLPVLASILREYKRNCPDFSLRIMPDVDARRISHAACCRESSGPRKSGPPVPESAASRFSAAANPISLSMTAPKSSMKPHR